MRARLAVLRPADVQRGGAAELDLRPFEVSDLGGAQAVAISDQHHGDVAVPIAAAAGRADEFVDLGRRQVLAGAEHAVGGPLRSSVDAQGQIFGFRMRRQYPDPRGRIVTPADRSPGGCNCPKNVAWRLAAQPYEH
jgi:hypothetical protein